MNLFRSIILIFGRTSGSFTCIYTTHTLRHIRSECFDVIHTHTRKSKGNQAASHNAVVIIYTWLKCEYYSITH